VDGVVQPASALAFTHLYAKGTHAVRVTVDDGQGTASCTTSVTVADTTPPVVSCSVAVSSLWPPNGALTDVGLQTSAHDACDGELPVAVQVTSDEGGSFAASSLPATRDSSGDGRVYLIQATAGDSSGNQGAACCTVTVPKNGSAASLASVSAQALQACPH
jgi:uncharacterized protein YjdB